ncbi:hypothetical protein HU200_009030 [Digitaria exilis]|uniref:Cytochrome P450 n=1 Tax=Digitaria exilis TaxID=1010633 RepID=A0A835FKS0_9POAL|nr:hypothetical protein HU200_009030 [Digitaria exilis]
MDGLRPWRLLCPLSCRFHSATILEMFLPEESGKNCRNEQQGRDLEFIPPPAARGRRRRDCLLAHKCAAGHNCSGAHHLSSFFLNSDADPFDAIASLPRRFGVADPSASGMLQFSSHRRRLVFDDIDRPESESRVTRLATQPSVRMGTWQFRVPRTARPPRHRSAPHRTAPAAAAHPPPPHTYEATYHALPLCSGPIRIHVDLHPGARTRGYTNHPALQHCTTPRHTLPANRSIELALAPASSIQPQLASELIHLWPVWHVDQISSRTPCENDMASSSLVSTALRLVTEYVRASDIAIAAAVLFVCSAIRNRLTTPPGAPMLWPVVGIIPSLFAHLDDIYEWGTAALARAGGTFPYRGTWGGGSSGVVTSVPANVEHVLKTNFANYPKGPYYRERFVELLGHGIFNADGDAWRAQRRAATAEMHSARFLEFSHGTIDALVRDKLVPLLEKVSEKGRAAPVHVRQHLRRGVRVDPGCLAEGLPDVPFARAFERATELSLARFVTPPFVWKAKRFLGVGTERELVEATRAVRAFAEATVAERRAELRKTGTLAGRCDLLSRLMSSSSSSSDSGGYSDEFLRDFCISFILAGRDTSSVGLAWFFWLLASHPDVESRVLADVLSSGDGGASMDYLHAALTESMRLYPPVPADFKEAVEDDVLPDGTFVRARQRVIYYAYAMGRDKSLWGPDCLEFRPERWLNGKKSGAFAGGAESPYKYVVFNAGPRLCVGKRFAYAQMKAVAAAVLGRFRVEVLPGQEKMKPKLNTTLYMRDGLMVRFARREQRHEPGHADVPAAGG